MARARAATTEDDGEKVLEKNRTVELDEPITFGTETISSIDLREPTFFEIVSAEKKLGRDPGPVEIRAYQRSLMESNTKLNSVFLDQMPISKMAECWAFLDQYSARSLAMLQNSPAT